MCKYFRQNSYKEDKDKRGRKPGEIAEILKEAVLKVNKNADLMVCLEEVEALKNAINISDPGDTIVVFYEKLDSLLEFLSKEQINEINTLKKCKTV
jgi:cyanophycin synthetase